MAHDWSPQQVVALDRVGRWLREKNKPFFTLAGYAGTGKTTLAKHLTASVDGMVYYACYTGKGAHVLRRTGIPNVSTIHKLIYKPKDKSQEHLRKLIAERLELQKHDPLPTVLLAKVEAQIKIEQDNLARPMFALNDESPLTGAALLVVDEYSMVDWQMREDLLSFGCPILLLGDPGQLPPVRGNPGFPGQPDVLLTEIHRQAENNPIIWLSREVREGRSLKPGAYDDTLIVRYGDVPKDEIAKYVLGCDQLLVGRNATRASSNARARELLGHRNVLPEQGDKLVCLRNNHDVGLLNGQMWTARTDAVFDGQYVILDLLGEEEGQRIECIAHADYFHGNTPEPWTRKDAEEFDYGNALTVHKSQGSQWDTTTLFDEWYSQHRKEWLYTGLTRAAVKTTIVQM